MDRINQIWNHPIFKECVGKNKMAEADRCFCHHDIEHFLAVARIAMLLNLQENLQIEKDLLYAAAFLHDIGRFLQYLENIPHEEASVTIAGQILPECGYDEGEIEVITGAIASHRGSSQKDSTGALSNLLYRADKMSRNCQFCEVYRECNWSEEMKRQELIF